MSIWLRSIRTKKEQSIELLFFVRIKGLEPPRLSASDPKSDVATNYTISASVCRHRSETLGKVSKFIRNLMPCAMKISNNHHFSTSLRD